MLIIDGMPGGRHFAVASYSEDPEISDLLMVCHFASYSGVSEGSSGLLPFEPSATGADAVGFGGGPCGASALGGPANRPKGFR